MNGHRQETILKEALNKKLKLRPKTHQKISPIVGTRCTHKLTSHA